MCYYWCDLHCRMSLWRQHLPQKGMHPTAVGRWELDLLLDGVLWEFLMWEKSQWQEQMVLQLPGFRRPNFPIMTSRLSSPSLASRRADALFLPPSLSASLPASLPCQPLLQGSFFHSAYVDLHNLLEKATFLRNEEGHVCHASSLSKCFGAFY